MKIFIAFAIFSNFCAWSSFDRRLSLRKGFRVFKKAELGSVLGLFIADRTFAIFIMVAISIPLSSSWVLSFENNEERSSDG